MTIAIVPFADEHLEPARQLLAARHRRMMEHETFLAADFSNPQYWKDVLIAAREKSRTGGLAAVADGIFAGHLMWSYDDTPRESILSAFSPKGVASAALDGFAVDPAHPSAARRLYAAASQEWIAGQRGTHRLPAAAADPEALEALYGLGFGRALTLAVREANAPTSVAHQTGIVFREAAPGDEDVVRRLAGDLWRSFAEPPVHFPYVPESMPDLYAYADRYIADPATPVWLAERDGRGEALEVFLTPGSSDWFLGQPLTPDGVIYLFWAVAAPEARGTRSHTALLNHTSHWAHGQGHSTIALHYLAASFAADYWQRQGFRPLVHWLSRTIDPRALPSL